MVNMLKQFLRSFAGLALALLVSSAAWAQTTLVVHKNANLRAKATTNSAIVDHLEPGDELTLLNETKSSSGFWRVRTEQGDEGWIYQTLVHREEDEDEEEDAVAP